MSQEIHRVERNIEDPLQNVAFTELPWMLNMAQLWIDERKTMGSVSYAIKNGFYKKYQRYGYKTDFIVNFGYLRLSVEEAVEFAVASPTEKSGELGDVLFHLLHFANGAGISADEVVSHIRSETLSKEQNTKLSLPARLAKLVFRKSTIPSMVKWHKENVARDNMELLGIMPGDEAPWTLNRESTEWIDYQQSLVSNWALVFATICQYSLENNIPLLESVYQTASKASYNFPPPFFTPEFTPFSSGPTTNNKEISCCRLFRKYLTGSDGSLIDQYHQMFDEQKVANDPKIFRQWIYQSLLSINNKSKNEEFRAEAYWLLSNFKWESLE